jgi:ribosomal protein S12 methylthiotransferase
VNTCGFIESAKQESIDAILEATTLKAEGKAKRVIVAGCLVERYRDDLMKELPEVDAFIGTSQINDILKAAMMNSTQSNYRSRRSATSRHLSLRRIHTANACHAIAHCVHKDREGCDRPCAFCSIPSMRGSFRSRRFGSIVEEAECWRSKALKRWC